MSMIRSSRLPFAALSFFLLIVSGCEQTSTPVRRDILGSWVSEEGFPVRISMTLAETARSIDGAGGWTEDGVSHAFRVSGAHARNTVSLYFDFDTRPDVSFQGSFVSEDVIDGALFGGGFSEEPVRFVRGRLEL